MPSRINKPVAPRNPIARALAARGGSGAHQQTRSSQRQQNRTALQNALGDWRDDLEFERKINNRDETSDGSRKEPSQLKFKKTIQLECLQ